MSKGATYSSIEGTKRVTMTWWATYTYPSIDCSKQVTMTWRATSICGCPWAEGKKGAPKAAPTGDDDKGQPGFTLNER